MASTYPTALDSFTNPTSTQAVSASVGGRTHSAMHADVNDAVEKIQAELGTNPSSTHATVALKLSTAHTLAVGAIPKTIVDAKGDLIVGTAADTAGRLAVGTNGYVPVARSTAASGITWETPPAAAVANLAPNAAADGAWVGPKVTLTAGETLSLGSICKISTGGKCVKADADAIATASPQFIALSTFASNSSGSFGMPGGFLYAATLYNWTVGGLVYLSTTAGTATQTAPSGTDDVVAVLGVATHADKIYFNPSLVQGTHT